MGAIPQLTTTRGLRSSVFDRHQEQMKKQLLPKDLAARAEKLAPEKVEAEVLRIVSAKPAVPPLQAWPQMLQPGQIVPQLQQARQDIMQRQLQAGYGGSLQDGGSLWGF
jgi:hypothetical protein